MSYIPNFANPVSTLKKRVLLGFNQDDTNELINQPLNPGLISGFTTETSVNFKGSEFIVDSSSSIINTDTLAITASGATMDVSNNYTTTVGGNQTTNITGTIDISAGSAIMDVSNNYTTTVGGNQSTDVTGTIGITSNSNITITPGNSSSVYVPGTFKATTVNQVNASGTVYLLVPTATVVPYAGTNIINPPIGWVFCDGSAYDASNNSIYRALWDTIGTTYGGSNITNFRVPDLRSRVPVGYNSDNTLSGRSTRSLNATGGTETYQLTADNLPDHTHSIDMGNNGINIAGSHNVGTSGSTGGINGNGNASSGDAFGTMPPYIVLNYLIKY